MTRVDGIRVLLSGGALALLARVVVACADDGQTLDVAAPDAGPGAIPEADGAPSDGGLDATEVADATPNRCSVDGWCHTELPSLDSFDATAYPPNLNGYRYGLRSVWIAPDHRVWAVTSMGHVLVYDGSWHVVAVLDEGLDTIWGPSATELWIGGLNGLLVHGTVAGGTNVSFERVPIDTTENVLRIVGTSASDVWIIPDGLDGYGTFDRLFHFVGKRNADGPVLDVTTVPSAWNHVTAELRISALWSSGADVWVAGHEQTCGDSAEECDFHEQMFIAKRKGQPDGGSSWEHMPLRYDSSNPIAAARTTTDGVSVLGIRGDDNQAWVARVSTDESKLDPDAGGVGITHEDTYGWTSEVAHAFGYPTALWATTNSDVWMVGRSGVMRHFDGAGWQVLRLSPTTGSPLLRNLFDINAGIGPSGELEMWVVGDDVAMHRPVKP